MFNAILPITFLILGYFLAPILLIWGWTRWNLRRTKQWTVSSALSFAGLVCSSSSAIFAICVILFANLGGFLYSTGPVNYETNYRLILYCIWIGAALAAIGFVLAIGGLWRRNPLRWLAPASAIATLAFWLVQTAFIPA